MIDRRSFSETHPPVEDVAFWRLQSWDEALSGIWNFVKLVLLKQRDKMADVEFLGLIKSVAQR